MSDSTFGLVELLIFLAIPLVWGIWELLSLRRERKRDAESERR